ncbi:CBS domain-containing protein [Aquabacterium sp. A7-Y]|uniref:CBS domain-containing protein n=1 Tax=Aquabacterium sp. A7-Y TaxID=1349605 RepID=UPI00223D99D2|nr:CBS domain-containing protein [Aquabacterium sp. A7-Y]MCW7541133.1 CBS domain-containing protein [Aquabacterium sp. A7-Y]
MDVSSICQRDVVTIDRDMNLQDAARRMRDEHVGALVVTAADSSGTTVIGVVTDRDLTIEVLAQGHDSASRPISKLVSGRLVAVPSEATLSDAIAAMESEGVRRLLVTGPHRELVGIVSIDDLIEAWASDMTSLAQSLRKSREREAKAALPASLSVDGVPLTLPYEALIPAWQRAH